MPDISQFVLPVKDPMTGEVSNVKYDIKGDSSTNFVGTSAEWAALTDAQKAQYTTVDLTDDNSGYLSTLDGLTDVDLTTPTNGQVLKYNSITRKWENGTGGGGGASSLSELSDVSLSSLTNGQVLKYNSITQKFENANVSGTYFLSQTLVAGSTSVTFTNIPTTGNTLSDFYTSTGINYTAIDTSTSGQITLTFPVQSTNVTVWCEIRGITT